jgi:cleavage stimulation factor subunit 2
MVRDITHKSERTANVDTGGTEELITETLGRVGHVNNFRLVYDKETGRPKGFGFAEFADADAAASAVRNLNDYDIMGRKLRVDWSNDNGAGDNAPPGHVPAAMPPAHSAQPTNGQAPEPAPSSALGPLPPGADLPPNLTCPDAISRTLSTLPPDQLMDILSQMKGLVMTDPLKATELLRQAPQLAYAIFQSLLLLDLVNPQMLGALVETAPPVAAAPVAQPPVQQQPPPVARPPPNYAYPPQPQPVHTPQPHAQHAYAQPPPPQPQPAVQPSAVDPQQAMYAQVLALTPDQINQLAPDQRAQILQLRQFLMAGGRP